MDILEELATCHRCGTRLTEGSSRCGSCGATQQRQRNPSLRVLLWMAKTYRLWSLAVFAYAVLHLFLIGQFKSYFVLFLVVFPFSLALAISCRMGNATSYWIVAFLILVDLGVVLAPEHTLLPMLNLFPEMPRTQSRIITWYLLVYAMLQFVILPPFVFFRSLRTFWSGGKPALSPWICLFGFSVWGLIAAILVIGAVATLG